METLWFTIVAFMLAAYVILDGFDLGAGIIHHSVARTDAERRAVLRAIGPVWDGNEVWLLAAGGTLYFAFPVLYSASFSGFYLPLMMVLWLLMLRGVGVELRNHVESPVWHSFWDFTFTMASGLLAIFFGAALGNVIRGVPLNSEGYFFEPLWTNFAVGQQNGILDWYTVLAGVVAFLALTVHGANYVAKKTAGKVNTRARRVAAAAWWPLAATTVLSLVATLYVRPQVTENYFSHRWGLVFPMMVALGLVGMFFYRVKGCDGRAFLSSTIYLAGMLAGAAFALFPVVLPASTDPALSLTIHNASAQPYGLWIGIVWWCFGITLALFYFAYLYLSFRGKVGTDLGEGY